MTRFPQVVPCTLMKTCVHWVTPFSCTSCIMLKTLLYIDNVSKWHILESWERSVDYGCSLNCWSLPREKWASAKHPRRRMCWAMGWLAQSVLILLQKQLHYFTCQIPKDVLPHICHIAELAKGALGVGFEMHSFIFMWFLKAKLACSQMQTRITQNGNFARRLLLTCRKQFVSKD